MKTAFSNILRSMVIVSVLAVGFVLLPIQPAHALSQPQEAALGIDDLNANPVGGQTGAQDFDPYRVARNIVNFVLSFLGIIAVGIILFAGFKWMTAGGKDEQVTEAQTMLLQGVIGLVIVIAAWGLATWVITRLAEAVTGQS
ncbi:MAG: pilin [bacterium]|nr:pilin [bacterium]